MGKEIKALARDAERKRGELRVATLTEATAAANEKKNIKKKQKNMVIIIGELR